MSVLENPMIAAAVGPAVLVVAFCIIAAIGGHRIERARRVHRGMR